MARSTLLAPAPGSASTDLWTPREDLSYVRRYLGLQQVRLGDRLHSEESIEDGLDEIRLPVLVVQPLVDSAISGSRRSASRTRCPAEVGHRPGGCAPLM